MTDSYIVELKYCKFIEGWIWCYVRSCWSNSVRNHVKNRSLDLYQVCGFFLLLFARNDGNVHLGVCANKRKNAEKTTIHC